MASFVQVYGYVILMLKNVRVLELKECTDARIHIVRRGEGSAQIGQRYGDALPADLFQRGFLGRDVAVQAGGLDAEILRDRAGADAMVTVLCKRGGGRVDDALPLAASIDAKVESRDVARGRGVENCMVSEELPGLTSGVRTPLQSGRFADA